MKYLSVLILFSLLSCVAPQPALKVYTGPEQSLDSVSSIRGSNLCSEDGMVIGETRILSINGVDVNSFSNGYQRDLLVDPGQTKLSVFWLYGNIRSAERTPINFEAEAGHRYIIRAHTDYKTKISYSVDDLGAMSGAKEFIHPKNSKGKDSNCY